MLVKLCKIYSVTRCTLKNTKPKKAGGKEHDENDKKY
jgi:hypothetical protein